MFIENNLTELSKLQRSEMLILGKIEKYCSAGALMLDWIFSKVFFEAEILVFTKRLVPLSHSIFYAEPQHKRISSSIGAKLEVLFYKKVQSCRGSKLFDIQL
ncbi:hypothetical protein [Flavobacterium sp. LAR06]|uniref:hypothetical protein n=1 Tax=Flavobacterium sp. LAR06 TaxID=3064897 RepID=UPI0035C0722C